MCLGGGGGDGGAAAREAERQAEIKNSVAAINSVFNNPAQQQIFDRHQDAVFDLNNRDLQRQFTDAGRGLKFQLARQGQSGGSVAIDRGNELSRLLDEGVLKARRQALQSANTLRSADENARLGLLSQAQGGLDATTASERAFAQRQLGADQAAAQGQIANIGDVFGSLSGAFSQRATNQGIANAGNQGIQGQSGGAQLFRSTGPGSRTT